MNRHFPTYLAFMLAIFPDLMLADCVAIDRMALIHNAVVDAKSQTNATQNQALFAVLDTQLSQMNYADLTAHLTGSGDTVQIAPVIQFYIATAFYLEAVRSDQAQTANTFLHSPDMQKALQAAAHGIQSFHCAVSVSPIFDLPTNNSAAPASGNATTEDTTDKDTNIFGVTAGPLALIVLLSAAASGALLKIFTQRQRRQKRRAKRYIVSLETDAIITNDKVIVKLLDMSGQGAKIQLAEKMDLKIGTSVQVNLLERMCPASVVWGNAFYVGLRFAAPFKSKEVRAIVERSKVAGTNKKAAPKPEPPSNPKG